MSLIDIVDPEGVRLAAEKSSSGKRHLNRAAPGQGKDYQYFRAYYERNREKILAVKKKWSMENAEWEKRRKRIWGRNYRKRTGPGIRKGEAHPVARLTPAKVIEIRARYERDGVSLRQLAVEYGISDTGVWKVVKRETWAHVTDPGA